MKRCLVVLIDDALKISIVSHAIGVNKSQTHTRTSSPSPKKSLHASL